MNEEQIWNDEEPIADRFEGGEVPEWIEPDISPSQVAAIVQGGCDSGAYMPAVTYHQALETMNQHGDDVLQYVEDSGFNMTPPVTSWAGIACYYLSCAVEQWANDAYATLEDFEPDEDESEVA